MPLSPFDNQTVSSAWLSNDLTANGLFDESLIGPPAAGGVTPTRGQVSWVELEVPFVGTRGRLSWAELQVPFVGTRGRVSWSELEVPFKLTRGRMSWAEFEAPFQATRGRLSWAEFEVPFKSTRGRVSWAELEVPTRLTRGQVSWTALEVPDPAAADPTRGLISWVVFEVPTIGGVDYIVITRDFNTAIREYLNVTYGTADPGVDEVLTRYLASGPDADKLFKALEHLVRGT